MCFSLNPFFPPVISVCLLRIPKNLSVKTIGFQLSIISGTKAPVSGRRSYKATEQNEWQWGQSAVSRNQTAPSLGSPVSLPSLQINQKLLSASCVPCASLISQGQGVPSWKTWLFPWTCPFIQFPKVFSSPLVPPFIAGSSRQLQQLFFPLFLKKHTASVCLWR